MCILDNCETYIYYPIYCCMPVVTTGHTSHARYLQVIRGLNTSVIINSVFEVMFWVTELIQVTRTIDRSY